MGEAPIRGHRLILVVILAVAAVLRVIGLDFGLPVIGIRPDEEKILLPALSFFSGDYDPHLFNYPSLHLYLLHAALAPWYWLGMWTGHYRDWLDLLHDFQTDPTPFVIFARGVSALLSVASVALIYDLGRRMHSVRAGWIAASAYAVTMGPVREAHFATVDTPQVFFMLLALRAALILTEKNAGPREAARAVVLGGLAASVKYTGGLVMIPVSIALAGWCRQSGRSPVTWVLLGGVVSVMVFLAGSPYIVLDFEAFQESFGRIVGYFGSTPSGGSAGGGWWQLLGYLVDGLGVPVLIAGVGGLLIAMTRATGRLVAALFISSFLLLGIGQALFFRYSLPLMPPLCLGLGVLTVTVLSRFRWADRTPVMVLVAAMLVTPAALRTLHLDRLLAAPETRNRLIAWIEASVPSEATIVTNVPIGQIGSLRRADDAALRRIESLEHAESRYLTRRGTAQRPDLADRDIRHDRRLRGHARLD
ncbi:MAG: glycosyltransferase family 39 protein, partial [Planctomycetota bacterium]